MRKSIKVIAKLGLFYLPDFLKRYIQERAQKQELNFALTVARRTKVSKEQFAQALEEFSFDTDIMLHCSMMNIGKIAGGAKFVSSSIIDAIDVSKNTLVVSALPYRGSFALWLDENRVFDVRSADIAMGAVNERLSMHPGALRSVHPTHSVVAIGPKALKYVDNHHLDDTPFGAHSPYYKLIENNAKILLVGATHNNVTFIHAIEDLLGDVHPVKVYSKRQYQIPCIDQDGNRLTVKTTVHAPKASALRDCSCMNDLLKQRGMIKQVPIGESFITMFDCYDYAMTYLDYLANGRSIYGRHRVTPQLLSKIEDVKETLKSLKQK